MRMAIAHHRHLFRRTWPLILSAGVGRRTLDIPTAGLRCNSTLGVNAGDSSVGSRHKNSLVFPGILLLTSMTTGIVGFYVAKATQTLGPVLDVVSEPNFGSPEDFKLAIKELKASFPSDNAVSTDTKDLYTHGFSDKAYYPGTSLFHSDGPCDLIVISFPGAPHSVIVYPRSTEDVVQVVKIATKYRMPITPYAGATSLEGAFCAVRRSCCGEP